MQRTMKVQRFCGNYTLLTIISNYVSDRDNSPNLVYIILGVWTWTMLQFPFHLSGMSLFQIVLWEYCRLIQCYDDEIYYNYNDIAVSKKIKVIPACVIIGV